MHIRVAVPGIPSYVDRTTWPFPTAGLVSYDPVNGTAIFDVPDADAPLNPPAAGTANRPNTPVGPVLIAAPQPAVDAMWTAIQAKYPGSAGVQKPTIK